MGNNPSSGTTISKDQCVDSDPNAPPPGGNKPVAGPGQPQLAGDPITNMITTRYRQTCPDNNLTYERFKVILLDLEQYGLPQLRDTPTGFRLYEILTVVTSLQQKNGTQMRPEQAVAMVDGLMKNTNEAQLMYSWEIIDRNQTGAISFQAFQAFALDCWMAAFRNLNTMIQMQPNCELPQACLEAWASSKRGEFSAEIQKEFQAHDSNRRGVRSSANT